MFVFTLGYRSVYIRRFSYLCIPLLPNSDLIACLRPHYPSIAPRVSCIYSSSDNILLVAASALLLQVRVSSSLPPSLPSSLARSGQLYLLSFR